MEQLRFSSTRGEERVANDDISFLCDDMDHFNPEPRAASSVTQARAGMSDEPRAPADSHDDIDWGDQGGTMDADPEEEGAGQEQQQVQAPPIGEFLTTNRSPNFARSDRFLIDFHDICQKDSGMSLSTRDKIVKLVGEAVSSGKLTRSTNLPTRNAFINSLETKLGTGDMKPGLVDVDLSDNSKHTLAVFPLVASIQSLLQDKSLMDDDNLAAGLDIFTGHAEESDVLGEVHTGTAWPAAVEKFCDSDLDMPVGLIIFIDKTHTDLHGSLSTTPVLFTLTLFGQKARPLPHFWRVLGFMPNLSHGKGSSDQREAYMKCQDEHVCLAKIFEELIQLNKDGGVWMEVKGRVVRCKVFVHFFVGDMEGNRALVGHYKNSTTSNRPHYDCNCPPGDGMSNTNPTCTYTTLDDKRRVKRMKLDNSGSYSPADIAREFKDLSRYDIDTIFEHPYFPLSDSVYGANRMMPIEMLHGSWSGTMVYMLNTLGSMFGTSSQAKKDLNQLDKTRLELSRDLTRSCERGNPRGSSRNGITDSTKTQASERRGDMYQLLLLSFTSTGKRLLMTAFSKYAITIKRFQDFLKSYLAMEAWFHSNNPKTEVDGSRRHIAKVLKEMQAVFPRTNNKKKDEANPRVIYDGVGWEFPKMHGMTKFQTYIKLFGSAINFYGGHGESHHKYFVKAPGENTQRIVSEFVAQLSQRVYECLVLEIAKSECDKQVSPINS